MPRATHTTRALALGLLVHSAGAFGQSAAPASPPAPTLTLTVPMTLTNVHPAVRSVRLDCIAAVYDAPLAAQVVQGRYVVGGTSDPKTVISASGANGMKGSGTLPVANGAGSGNVVVSIPIDVAAVRAAITARNATPGPTAASAAPLGIAVYCELSFGDPASSAFTLASPIAGGVEVAGPTNYMDIASGLTRAVSIAAPPDCRGGLYGAMSFTECVNYPLQ